MHRTIEITIAPKFTAELAQKLEAVEHVIGLSVQYGLSLKPKGDILTVHVLNRGADQVLKITQQISKQAPVSIVTAEVTSFNDASHQQAINNDVDEAIWEEMETGLRHQGRISSNFIMLMALGGSIATVGLISDPAHQAIAFVASAIIAPGFEPIAKIPLGIILKSKDTLLAGLKSAVVGYLILILSGALSFYLLRLTHAATMDDFVKNIAVEHIIHPTFSHLLVSICGAASGIIMIVAYRRNVIAGPLIALIIIPGAVMIGMAVVAGNTVLMYQALERTALDLLFIIGVGLLIIYLKQKTLHRRSPMR